VAGSSSYRSPKNLLDPSSTCPGKLRIATSALGTLANITVRRFKADRFVFGLGLDVEAGRNARAGEKSLTKSKTAKEICHKWHIELRIYDRSGDGRR
jgi:hypothetical protein